MAKRNPAYALNFYSELPKKHPEQKLGAAFGSRRTLGEVKEDVSLLPELRRAADDGEKNAAYIVQTLLGKEEEQERERYWDIYMNAFWSV